MMVYLLLPVPSAILRAAPPQARRGMCSSKAMFHLATRPAEFSLSDEVLRSITSFTAQWTYSLANFTISVVLKFAVNITKVLPSSFGVHGADVYNLSCICSLSY